MDFGKQLKTLFEKIENIKIHYSICISKGDHTQDCKTLQETLKNVQEQLQECQQHLNEWPELKAKIQQEEENIRRYKQFMLRALELIEELPKDQPAQPTAPGMVTPTSVLRERNFETPGSYQIRRLPSSVSKTPSSVMRSGMRAKSPFVTRSSINPQEFDFCLAPRHFDSIPKYMRGRDTKEDLQNFLDGVIGPCFCEKYSMMCRDRNSIPIRERNLFDLFYEQEKDFPNRKFITQGDISRYLGSMLDKRTSSRIQMLRHIKILQDVRKKSSIYYIWLPVLNTE
ncbi:spindle and kinetochore-associated protein 1-like [Lutzomyia longipalpis]|uniref:spindle and kinetochore-associated protein 1-like n=1 Tax=Lutzomyia longipalpis TaxID=7200 RepID=UPI0024841C37|nr:spindle and kinetochore-associated protein 1-like [Lutzomyia longipalpis]